MDELEQLKTFDYGIFSDYIDWDDSAYRNLFYIACKEPNIKKKIEAYSIEEGFDSLSEAFDDMLCLGFQYWDGIEGFVCHIINRHEFGGKPIFKYENGCIFVPAQSDVDDEHIVSQDRIKCILNKYVEPLMEEKLETSWRIHVA